jgi:hypothetical protein
MHPCAIDRRFDRHLTVFELSRAFDNAGNKIEINSAMIPITTSSSTSVNPRCLKRPAPARKRERHMHACLENAINPDQCRLPSALSRWSSGNST